MTIIISLRNDTITSYHLWLVPDWDKTKNTMLSKSLTYLQPETLSRLKNMELRARFAVEGFLTGLHQSPYHGFSVEFAEHRQYMPGDPLRNIDWKVYARTEHLHVKEYEEETNLKCHILLDRSASMAFTSGKISKLDYAAYLASALTYLMLKQRDAVGLSIFDTTVSRHLPPRSVMGYLHVVLRELESLKHGTGTRIGATLHELAERIHRRGLIILLSDLLDDPDEVMSGLKHFRHRQHDVLVFHIMDPREVDFAFDADAVFEDMETGEKLNTQSWHIQAAYRQQVQAFVDQYKRQCREHRIDYMFMDTSQSLDQALSQYLIKRKRMR